MGKINKNQQGFGAVEALLILVILGIVGFTGYYVWHAKQDTDKNLAPSSSTVPLVSKKANASTANKSANSSTSSQQTTTDSYAGWKTYTSKFGFTFKYPSTARVDDNTTGAATINDKTGPNSVDVYVYADGYSETNCPVTNPENFPTCLVKVEFTLHPDTSADGVIVNSTTAQLKAQAQLVIDSYKKKGA